VPLLLRKDHEIKAHWHATASDLAAILPRSGGNYWPIFEHYVSTLSCTNFQRETALRLGGLTVPIVPLLQTTPGDPLQHWLGWHEEWIVPNRGRAGRFMQFRSSALTVYFGKTDSPKRQLLRAEWAGVEREENEKDIFQSQGSAHPHWHVDGIKEYFDDLRRQYSNRQISDDLSEEKAQEFDAQKAEQDASSQFAALLLDLPTNDELCWTRIHLAAHAKWATEPWPGPAGPNSTHATGPRDLPALRSWLTSCARYLQAQIENELLRHRR
jgi:hypothetical protein